MGVSIATTTKLHFVCDRCEAEETIVIEGKGDPQGIMQQGGEPGMPTDWARITCQGLPAPAVHKMRKLLEGDAEDPSIRITAPMDINDILNNWDDDDSETRPIASRGDPLGSDGRIFEAKRLLCGSCLIDVWAAIGLPKTKPKAGVAKNPILHGAPGSQLQGLHGLQPKPVKPPVAKVTLYSDPAMSINPHADGGISSWLGRRRD